MTGSRLRLRGSRSSIVSPLACPGNIAEEHGRGPPQRQGSSQPKVRAKERAGLAVRGDWRDEQDPAVVTTRAVTPKADGRCKGAAGLAVGAMTSSGSVGSRSPNCTRTCPLTGRPTRGWVGPDRTPSTKRAWGGSIPRAATAFASSLRWTKPDLIARYARGEEDRGSIDPCHCLGEGRCPGRADRTAVCSAEATLGNAPPPTSVDRG